MIKKQLEQLTIYIKEIEQMEPLDFFCIYIKKVEQELMALPVDITKTKKQFMADMEKLFEIYLKNNISEDVLIVQSYQVLLQLLQKHAIYSYALMLGLEPSLFKDEMRFLFKGK